MPKLSAGEERPHAQQVVSNRWDLEPVSPGKR